MGRNCRRAAHRPQKGWRLAGREWRMPTGRSVARTEPAARGRRRPVVRPRHSRRTGRARVAAAVRGLAALARTGDARIVTERLDTLDFADVELLALLAGGDKVREHRVSIRVLDANRPTPTYRPAPRVRCRYQRRGGCRLRDSWSSNLSHFGDPTGWSPPVPSRWSAAGKRDRRRCQGRAARRGGGGDVVPRPCASPPFQRSWGQIWT